MKLAATLHHPNGDIMETVFAMDYETLETFLKRMSKRWQNHITQCCKMCVGFGNVEA